MAKTAFLFPGQGSQKVGMGKDLFDRYDSVKKIFASADEALGYSISKMCFEGPEEDLKLTANTQPAILTCSVALLTAMREEADVKCDAAAGHSLGEYSALVAAGVLDFADAVYAVHKRGQFMQEAVPVGEGAMAAVLGLAPEVIDGICHKVEDETKKTVQAVNFNCPGQVAIAGSADAVAQAVEELKAAGAKRSVMLPVSAPFHSRLMEPAALRLKEVLDKFEFHDAAFPVVSNVTATFETKADKIKELLVKQAASPVRWENSMRNMIADGFDIFVEIGPGKVLSGFTRKIDREKTALNAEDLPSMEKTLAQLGEVR